jgi:hypothetical protein
MNYFDQIYGEPGVVTAFKHMHLPCGGVAYFDRESCISYRCETCFAVVGSVGQPQRCKDQATFWDNWEEMGGKGWDYDKGKPK